MTHTMLIKKKPHKIVEILKKKATVLFETESENQKNGLIYFHYTFIFKHRKWNVIERENEPILIAFGNTTKETIIYTPKYN